VSHACIRTETSMDGPGMQAITGVAARHQAFTRQNRFETAIMIGAAKRIDKDVEPPGGTVVFHGLPGGLWREPRK
jgi:hypothetical protein